MKRWTLNGRWHFHSRTQAIDAAQRLGLTVVEIADNASKTQKKKDVAKHDRRPSVVFEEIRGEEVDEG